MFFINVILQFTIVIKLLFTLQTKIFCDSRILIYECLNIFLQQRMNCLCLCLDKACRESNTWPQPSTGHSKFFPWTLSICLLKVNAVANFRFLQLSFGHKNSFTSFWNIKRFSMLSVAIFDCIKDFSSETVLYNKYPVPPSLHFITTNYCVQPIGLRYEQFRQLGEELK